MSFTTPVPDAAGGQNPQNESLYVPAGTGVTKWVAGGVNTIKASATTTNGSFGFVEASVPPGGGPTAHVHRRSDEAFYLMYGELELLTGDRIFTARSGDFIFVPRGQSAPFQEYRSAHREAAGDVQAPAALRNSSPRVAMSPAGVPPPVWDMNRFEQVQEVIDRFGLDFKAVPEPPSSTT